MKILVTGAAGFIGFHLCRKLLSLGHIVVGLDNFITGTRQNINLLSENRNFIFHERDINFLFILQKKILEVEQIYHLACPTGVDNLMPLAEEMLTTCSAGTKNILEIARTNGAKFLFTSSSEVYGNPKISPQKENYTGNVDIIGVRSPYEEGKRFAESLITAYVTKYKIDARIVRVFNTYGPAMSQSDTRVIPRFLRQAMTGQPLTVKGRGVQKRTFCYVDGLIDGLIKVMEKGKIGEAYNLGSNVETAIIDLAKLIIKITGSKSKIQFVSRPPHDHQRRLPDLKKVRKLGWQPKIGLEDGLKITAKWFGS
ncbi:GDP-mannose 4,6-dehydratase [Candidatus Curtissbacteria bacterium]|nr:GDP-mannose 4,6-dehydratase [Candidatus Curtissbacteria bacterium]